jgi:hypothetical protein
MSAPVSHDPLVVNTSDGAVWMRRAVTRDGHGLYVVADAPACCPPFVMATLAELAEHGIAGSADVLPVPVGREPSDREKERAAIAELIGDAEPASDGLVVQLGQSVRDRREHEHPTWEDLYCLNLTSFMGERMGPVLRRLLDAEAEVEKLRGELADRDLLAAQNRALEGRVTRYRLAWRAAYQRAQGRGWAADRAGARARDLQEALQHMLFSVIGGQMALHEANRERQELRDRVEELLAERHSTNEALSDTTVTLHERETAPLTVYRASHDSIVMGMYTAAAEARKHCETVLRREYDETTKVSLWWRDDEGNEEQPQDGEVELIAHVTPHGFPKGRTWYTGYVVTSLAVSASYDEGADE